MRKKEKAAIHWLPAPVPAVARMEARHWYLSPGLPRSLRPSPVPSRVCVSRALESGPVQGGKPRYRDVQCGHLSCLLLSLLALGFCGGPCSTCRRACLVF